MIVQTGPMVYEYLASVVLNRQSDDIRRFMIDSAVLPVMTAADCDQVLQRKDSQRYLSRTLREGLFITTTDISPRTYEYHPQFRKFLLDLLSAADNKRLRSLRIRAAVYLEEAGSIDKAVDLYLDAGADHQAVILAEKHAQGMFYQGRVQTLKDWGLRLKESNMAAPKVFLYIAKSYTDQGELEKAKASLHEADRMIGKKTPKGVLAKMGIQRGMIAVRQRDYDAAWKATERAEKLSVGPGSRQNRAASLRLKALVIYYQRGDLGKAERLVKEGAKLMAESVYRYDLAMNFTDLAMIKAALGKSLEAYSASQRAHEILLEVGSPLPLSTSYNNLAFSSHMKGDYEKAAALFRKGLKCARRARSPAREIMILFGQADLFNDLALSLQAAELYEQGLTLATRLNNQDMIQYGCLQTSVLHRRQGSGNLPHQWLQRAVSLSGSSQMSDAARIQLAALEMAASPENARATLMDILSKESRLDAGERTLVFYFLTKAAIADGNQDDASQWLEKALSWAGGHGREQILAAEMMSDEEFQKCVGQSLPGHPVLSVVINRIETMQAVANQYKEVGEEPAADTRMVVKALGQISIERFGVSLPELKPLAREVFVYLVDNHRVDRDVLLETFWPKYSPGRQVSNLYTAIYSLRRVLGKGAIVLDGSVYGFNPEMPVEYDVARFERAASITESLPPGDPRRPFALTEAINSYGGKFLEELSSDWVLERRRILETRYLELLIVHADEALIRDQPLKAVNSLRRALEIDPCRDDVNLTYLEALGRLERRSEIVAHYQRYVRLLSDELGLDPPESVSKLYTRLLG
jgi:ATP/maltotriose-dependent transcriptional regulator MalT/DNA-binding SARP family transcriptional activator